MTNDPFITQSPYPLLTFFEAWQLVEQQVRPLPPRRLPLTAAGGLVLAQDVLAADDVPAFAASTMDGYAIIGSDPARQRRVTGEDVAGQAPDVTLRAGECRRIMTGASLPLGADAVLPVEETSEQAGWMHTTTTLAPGANVRPIGSDVRAGQRVLAQGMLLGPAEIGLLATLGQAEVSVHPRPRVLVLATGDELVAPGQPLAAGQIYESNSYALVEAVRTVDCDVTRGKTIMDTAEAVTQGLRQAITQADLVITTGGVSMGTRDLLKPVLATLGAVHFGRVATKPGKPLTFATIQGVPLLALPGNPVSTLVGFEMYVRPALRLLAGKSPLWRPTVQARLAHEIKRDAERLDWQRARITPDNDGWLAETTGGQASSRLLSLVGANGLLCIEPGVGRLPAGALVNCILLAQPESATTPW